MYVCVTFNCYMEAQNIYKFAEMDKNLNRQLTSPFREMGRFIQ